MLDKNLEKKWLIKSENKILGPYHFDQIEELLKKRQISLIDEIRDMETRWLYVRENLNFKNIVEEIRKEIDSKNENTKNFQTGSRTNTDTALKTNAHPPQFTEVDIQEASVVNESHSNESSYESEPSREKAKIYGLPQDLFFQKKAKVSLSRRLAYLGVVALLGLGTVGLYSVYQKRAIKKQEDEWMAQIKKYEFLEFDQRAVDLYAKLPEANQKKVLPEILSLYPLLESAHLTQLKEVEALQKSSDLNVEQKVNAQLIYFLNALQNLNIPVATDALVRARTLLPASNLVLENKAFLDAKNKDFQSSFDNYLLLYKNDQSGRYLVGCLQVLAGLTTAQKEKVTVNLSQLIEKHTSTYYDYKKELLLGQMALAIWNKNEILFKVSWSQFLNTPIQFSNLFKMPHLLPAQVYQWKDLEEYKIVIRSFLQPEDAIQFEIHNYLESSQVSAANQYAENNLAKIKDKAIKQQMTLLILHSQARKNEILALEKTNQLDPKSELNHILFALNKMDVNPQTDISVHLNFFETHQLVFYKDWLSLLQIMKKGEYEKVRPFLREHLVTLNHFIPIIEARSMTE